MHRQFALVLLACWTAATASPCSGGWDYAPEAVGRVEVDLPRGAFAGDYKLGAQESAAFDGALKKIRDLVLAQPHLHPPKGTDLRGWLRQWRSPACGARRPCLGAPVAGEGSLQYFYLLNIAGRPAPIIETAIQAEFAINNLEQAAGANAVATLGGQRRYLRQPVRWGELDGLPVYVDAGKGVAVLVLARHNWPWWRAVTVAEFLQAEIEDLQAAVKAEPPTSDAPAAELYRRWLAEAPQRKREADRIYEEVKRSNPALAETLRQSGATMEQDVGAGLRRDAEREQARAARGQASPRAPTLDDRLERHRQRLAALTPAERGAQAIFATDASEPLEPNLARPGHEAEGVPLVRVDPDYFDRSLPRTAIQIVALRFGIRYLEPIQADECGEVNPAFRALWQTVHQTPWREMRTVLAP